MAGSVYFREIVLICCQFYPNVHANFGRFILISNEMVLIFLGVLIVFVVSSLQGVGTEGAGGPGPPPESQGGTEYVWPPHFLYLNS